MRPFLLFVSVCLIAACGGGGGDDRPASPPVANNPAPAPAASGPTLAELNQASKLLARTTFGASFDDIQTVAETGTAAWRIATCGNFPDAVRQADLGDVQGPARRPGARPDI